MPRINTAAQGGTAVLEPDRGSGRPQSPAALPKPVSQPPAKPGGLKRVSFGAIAQKKDETKTAYPVFNNAQAAQIAVRIIERTEQLEALKGALDTDKAELKILAAPHYFTVNHGRHEVPSSVSVPCQIEKDGVKQAAEVLVTFQNRYPLLPDETGLLPVLGERTGEFFRQSFELKIKGDKLPDEHTQELLNRLQALFAEFGATDALEVKEGVKPVETFHAQRHQFLTPQQNMALEQIVPITAMIKTKGRK
jgi:hypothetical protein